MLPNVNLDLMRTLLKTSQVIRLKKVKDLRTVIEEKINDDGGKIQNFSLEELCDFHKVLQMCEFILEKYQNKTTLSQNLKKFVSIIDSTLVDLESLDDEIDELTISANFSLGKIKEFESDLIKSKTFPDSTHSHSCIFYAQHEKIC